MSLIASILEQKQGKIQFCVDDVKSVQDRLPLQTAKSKVEQSDSCQNPLLAFSHDDTFQVIQDKQIHPLALAIHVAFSEHRPLLLTPDIIWITIAQGFAQHVNNHAEELRSQFVRHQGKEKLIIRSDDIPTLPQQWAEMVQEWGLQIRDRVGADVYKLLECSFSTTTPITRTVSHVVMMDTFQQYFDYVVLSGCGIPNITLLGDVADWESIYERVQNISQYNLSWWTDRLLPICQEFINASAGKPSLAFWRCIYKPEAVYATEYITGWLADLFPYVRDRVTKAPTVQNPLLMMDSCPIPTTEKKAEDEEMMNWGATPDGISLDSLPLGLSKVNFKLKAEDLNRQGNYDLELVAGFIGVHQ